MLVRRESGSRGGGQAWHVVCYLENRSHGGVSNRLSKASVRTQQAARRLVCDLQHQRRECGVLVHVTLQGTRPVLVGAARGRDSPAIADNEGAESEG